MHHLRVKGFQTTFLQVVENNVKTHLAPFFFQFYTDKQNMMDDDAQSTTVFIYKVLQALFQAFKHPFTLSNILPTLVFSASWNNCFCAAMRET